MKQVYVVTETWILHTETGCDGCRTKTKGAYASRKEASEALELLRRNIIKTEPWFKDCEEGGFESKDEDGEQDEWYSAEGPGHTPVIELRLQKLKLATPVSIDTPAVQLLSMRENVEGTLDHVLDNEKSCNVLVDFLLQRVTALEVLEIFLDHADARRNLVELVLRDHDRLQCLDQVFDHENGRADTVQSHHR